MAAIICRGTQGFALEIIKDKFDLNTYVRGSAFIGSDYNQGKDPSLGDDFALTLFDLPYFETEAIYKVEKRMKVHFSVGLDNNNLSQLSGDYTNVHFVMRDFYAEAFNVGREGNTFWVGANKYHRLDDHNLYGLGYRFVVSPTLSAGVAEGMRQDFGYWGAQDANTPGKTPTLVFTNPYRQMSILDIEYKLSPNSNIVWVLERQYIGKTQATYTPDGSTQKFVYDLKPVSGQMTGMELNFWEGSRWSSSSQLVFENGDINGSALSKLNVKGSPTEILDQTGTRPLTVQYYRQDNQRLTATNYGSYDAAHSSVTYFAGVSFDRRARTTNQAMTLLQARPFYHLTENSHLGVDVSRTFDFIGYDKPSFTVIAPTFRYILNFDDHSKPQILLFLANAFFDRAYALYDSSSRYALTAGIRFEAYF